MHQMSEKLKLKIFLLYARSVRDNSKITDSSQLHNDINKTQNNGEK